MTQMVTRCPKCATAFRITSTQLESAKGAVRCGSCLHIFKAQDYLVKGTSPESVKVAPTEAISQTKVDAAKPQSVKPEPVKSEAVNKPQSQKTESVKIASEKPVPVKPEIPKVDTPKTTQTAFASAESIAAKQAVSHSATIKPGVQPATKPVVVTVAAPETAKPVIDKAKILEDEEDVLISDDMDNVTKSSTYEFDGFVDLDMHPKQTVSLFEREIRYEAVHDNDEETTDESWAEELLDDDGEPIHQIKKPIAPPPEPVIELHNEPEPISHTRTEPAVEPGNSYSGPVFSLVSEHDDDNKTPDGKEEPFFSEEFLKATSMPAEPIPESSAFAAALFEQEGNSAADNDESDKPSGKRPAKSSKMRAFDGSRAALLMNIIPAPVELTARRMRRWYQRRLWSNLVIIMSILLFVQIAYFKFDYFSRVEPYRTAYLFVCPVLGCEVPSLVDTSQILATNLIVRNHPNIASALMVDAILINNAPFEQPFPDLVLSFSKLDETPVASRRFTPKEYLAGELAGMRYIPERQPVHITLEIADPGPDAVNYTLATH